MMPSRVESGRERSSSGSNSGRLLRDIEEINKALYLHRTPSNYLISPSSYRSKFAGKTHFLDSDLKLANEELLHKEKKQSLWNWKPLKALTHIRRRKFYCHFFLHVHTIEGLPLSFNDNSLCVNWIRRDRKLQTRPACVSQGTAEYEETLVYRCPVYGSKNRHHRSAKYDPKLFLLYASVVGAPALDTGKQWIDLTRLLPPTMDELEEDKSSGKWTTSFKLTGKAKGAMLNVSFGFAVMGSHSFESSGSMNLFKLLHESNPSAVDHSPGLSPGNDSGVLQRVVGSVPSNSNHCLHHPSQSLDMKALNEGSPNQGSELSRSITFLYQKFDEGKLGRSQEFDVSPEQMHPQKQKQGYLPESPHDNNKNEFDTAEFTVIDQGIEFSTVRPLKLENGTQSFDGYVVETIDVNEIFEVHGTDLTEKMELVVEKKVGGPNIDKFVVDDSGDAEYDGANIDLTLEELESFSEPAELDSSLDADEPLERKNTKAKLDYEGCKMVRSLSLDDVTESVANDFLKLLGMEQNPLDLGYESEPQSPREHLFREFEEDALSGGNFILDFDQAEEQVDFSGSASTSQWEDCLDNLEWPLTIQTTEEHKKENLSLISRRNAKMLEVLETEALMAEWNLDEKTLLGPPRISSGGFGSPIYLPCDEPLEFLPIAEGLGSFLQTRDGGFLRSMNPSLFRNARNGGCLIMQVSVPVVLPVAMGSSIMEILEHWASVGYEKMCMQLNKLMPLEDLTGKKMEEAAWELASKQEVSERLACLQQESLDGQGPCVIGKEVGGFSFVRGYDGLMLNSTLGSDIDSDYVALKDVAPLAMDKIEALSIEGLRIQSGLSDEEAPSIIRPQSIGDNSAFLDRGAKVREFFCLEGASEAHVMDTKDKGDDIDELLSLSVTLDEWLKLDSGIFYDEDEISDQISKILGAHLAENTDLIGEMLTKVSKWDKPISESCGYLGNNLTVALRVQLRDPLRDYETVGVPMLALIEVERVFIDLKPKVSSTASGENADDPSQQLVESDAEERQEIRIQEGIPLFKITEVHIAGFKTQPDVTNHWDRRTQKQSGSRWLLAARMGRNKNRFGLKLNTIVKSSSLEMRKVHPMDTLWSISSCVHGPRAKWKELATLNLHIRNPDVVFLT